MACVDTRVLGMAECKLDQDLIEWLSERHCFGESLQKQLEARGFSCFQALCQTMVNQRRRDG